MKFKIITLSQLWHRRDATRHIEIDDMIKIRAVGIEWIYSLSKLIPSEISTKIHQELNYETWGMDSELLVAYFIQHKDRLMMEYEEIYNRKLLKMKEQVSELNILLP